MLLLLQPSTPDPRLRRAPLPGLRGMLLDAVALKLATRPAGLVVPTLVFALLFIVQVNPAPLQRRWCSHCSSSSRYTLSFSTIL
jgi:hypothetical protein